MTIKNELRILFPKLWTVHFLILSKVSNFHDRTFADDGNGISSLSIKAKLGVEIRIQTWYSERETEAPHFLSFYNGWWVQSLATDYHLFDSEIFENDFARNKIKRDIYYQQRSERYCSREKLVSFLTVFIL